MRLFLAVALAAFVLPVDARPATGAANAALPDVRVSTSTLNVPTYNYAGFLHWIHSAVYNMDYAWLDWAAYEASGPHAEPHAYTTVVAENDWLRLTFLPELGGRLYGITDKATGSELLYQNPVIKPTRWGPPEMSWWPAAGGIEWCLPVEEHGYESAVPWDYSVATAAGGATMTLWDTTATDRIRARVVVFLPNDQAAFTITQRLENPTAAPVTLKYWQNAMLAPGAANTVEAELRFVLPTDLVTVHSRGDDYLPGPYEPMSWPWYNDTDYSRLGNWQQWLGAFVRPQATQDWAGVYSEGVQHGIARVFPHQIAVGVKFFGMGWAQPIDWHNWTDDGSTYVELHGGPAATFADSITVDPGAAVEWTETWLPLRGLARLSYANAAAALGVKDSNGDLDLGAVLAGPGSEVSVRLWEKAGCSLLWHQAGLALAPGQPFTYHLSGAGLPADQVALGVSEGNRLLALSGKLECPHAVLLPVSLHGPGER